MYSDEEIVIFFSFFKIVFNAGVTLSNNKKGRDVSKLKAKINEYLFSTVYTLYSRKNSVLSFHFIILGADSEIFKCQETQKQLRIILEEELCDYYHYLIHTKCLI